MSVEGRYFTWTIPAGEDLSDLTPVTGVLFKAIALDDGKIAENGKEAGGILLYGGKADERISLGYLGMMKFVAGEDIEKGQRLTVLKDGTFGVAVPGTYAVGRCLDTAVSARTIGTGSFNFATLAYVGEDEGA